jgi:hypothetical protein
MKGLQTNASREGLHEKHVVATWNLENHLSIFLNHLNIVEKYEQIL